MKDPFREEFDFNDDGPCGLEGTEGFQEPGRVGHGNRIRDVQISIWNRAHKKGDHLSGAFHGGPLSYKEKEHDEMSLDGPKVGARLRVTGVRKGRENLLNTQILYNKSVYSLMLNEILETSSYYFVFRF